MVKDMTSSEVKFCNHEMTSAHLKTKYMVETLGLVQPIEYKLGNTNRKATFQYVPLLENLKTFLKNPDVLKYVKFKPLNQDDLITDIHNGSSLKNKNIFSNYPNIQILLYYDEFCAANPLRGNQSKHKMAVFYYTLGNIPLRFRSKIDDIQLALICKSSYIKEFGFHTILAPLLRDLKSLENEGLKIEGIPDKIKGSVVFLVSDNLGSHQIGGFSTCFNGSSATCRFCCSSSSDMQCKFRKSLFVKRTKDIHIRQINLINMDPLNKKAYGIKFDSPLNQLSFFHTSTSLPPDPMHDLLEGVEPMELKLIIKSLISSNYFSLDELNVKISNLKYGPNDYSNKPHPLPKNFDQGLKLNAARVWCLLRLLPLMIGEKVPENNVPVWDLLLLLREIVDIVLAPVINMSYVSYLCEIIYDHHALFKSLFPNVPLKPKHHFLVHYPNLILEFGPLLSCWSMRFESKHLYFKRIAQSIKKILKIYPCHWQENIKNCSAITIPRHLDL